MELWGSSYLVQDVVPGRLVGAIGASTNTVGVGTIRMSLVQEVDICALTREGGAWRVSTKWDIALRIVALLHLLLVQNRLLRHESPTLEIVGVGEQRFAVSSGGQASAVSWSWDCAASGIDVNPVAGDSGQFEIVLVEGVAVELVHALVKSMAEYGASRSQDV